MTENIVLVTIDSLRADHCGFMDSEFDLTPTLDELAEQGVVFENAIAPGPRTPSSMPSVFTGAPLLPTSGNMADYWQEWRAHIYRHMQRHRTVAERMQERGYETIGVSVNPWTEDTGFERGFDTYHQLNGENLDSYGPPIFRVADRLLHDNAIGEKLKWFNKREWFVQWVDFYDRIVESVRESDEPYFLWVFLLDAHQPYTAPRAYREETWAPEMYYASTNGFLSDWEMDGRVGDILRRGYRDSIRSVDAFLERLRGDLAADDPTYVIHSDHGEGFGEHGTWGHEQALYRENLHVPLVVANASMEGRVRAPVSLRRIPDLVAGLADDAGGDLSRLTSSFVHSMTETWDRQALTSDRWKYITDAEGASELYDADEDAGETVNLAAERPKVVSTLQSLVDTQWRSARELETLVDAVGRIEGPV